MDHIIVGGDNSEYFSFREKGILPMKAIKLESDYNKLDMNTPSVAEEHVTMRPRRHR